MSLPVSTDVACAVRMTSVATSWMDSVANMVSSCCGRGPSAAARDVVRRECEPSSVTIGRIVLTSSSPLRRAWKIVNSRLATIPGDYEDVQSGFAAAYVCGTTLARAEATSHANTAFLLLPPSGNHADDGGGKGKSDVDSISISISINSISSDGKVARLAAERLSANWPGRDVVLCEEFNPMSPGHLLQDVVDVRDSVSPSALLVLSLPNTMGKGLRAILTMGSIPCAAAAVPAEVGDGGTWREFVLRARSIPGLVFIVDATDATSADLERLEHPERRARVGLGLFQPLQGSYVAVGIPTFSDPWEHPVPLGHGVPKDLKA